MTLLLFSLKCHRSDCTLGIIYRKRAAPAVTLIIIIDSTPWTLFNIVIFIKLSRTIIVCTDHRSTPGNIYSGEQVRWFRGARRNVALEAKFAFELSSTGQTWSRTCTMAPYCMHAPPTAVFPAWHGCRYSNQFSCTGHTCYDSNFPTNRDVELSVDVDAASCVLPFISTILHITD
jgi:hypothetical protein